MIREIAKLQLGQKNYLYTTTRKYGYIGSLTEDNGRCTLTVFFELHSKSCENKIIISYRQGNVQGAPYVSERNIVVNWTKIKGGCQSYTKAAPRF